MAKGPNVVVHSTKPTRRLIVALGFIPIDLRCSPRPYASSEFLPWDHHASALRYMPVIAVARPAFGFPPQFQSLN